MSQSLSEVALRVHQLKKAYGDVVAVNGLDLEVYRGECFGLLGPNGAGKTTTIEICEGLNDLDSGTVEVLGMNWAQHHRTLRQRLGVQLQETQLSEKLTAYETVRLFRSFYAQGPPAAEVIALVHLDEKRDARVGALSGGQKQRLALACTLVGDPELVFLDEPTTGLDPQARRQVWDLITQLKNAGRTIVLTTHYMDEAEQLCERVAIVDRGKVIALGTPRELIAATGIEQVIAFSAASGATALLTEPLGRITGVKSIRRVDDFTEMQVAELHVAVPALLDELRRQDIRLAELRTHSATLEDVFVTLTGRHLRDV